MRTSSSEDAYVQNDEIEKLALERSSIYRKCRLEEVKLPLLQGHLRNVPMEESLRDEMAMDVDEEGDGTQPVRQSHDYGIEVDFGELEDDEREVCDCPFFWQQVLMRFASGRFACKSCRVRRPNRKIERRHRAHGP